MDAAITSYRQASASWAYPLARALPFMVFAFCRTMAGYYSFGATLKPDFGLYTAGVIRVYPSLFGTALGAALGPDGFVLLAAVASAALVLFVSRYSVGFLPILAATFLPLGWITFFAGIDGIAAAVFLYSWCNRDFRKGRVGLVVACSLHFALLPVLLALALRRHRFHFSVAGVTTAGLLLFSVLAGVLLATLTSPYLGIFGHLSSPAHIAYYALVTAVSAGAGWQAIAVLPWVRIHGSALFYDGAAAFAAGALEAGLQLHSQARYCLPGFLLLCTALRKANHDG